MKNSLLLIKNRVLPALILLIWLSFLTGIFYPCLVTGIAQWAWPYQANGSLIKKNEHFVGSACIGQYFSEPGYFWGRRSATPFYPYNALASAGSNLGPLNPILIREVKAAIHLLSDSDPAHQSVIPIDLVSSSASGLDPDISLSAALYQVPRIAKARSVSEQKIKTLIRDYTLPKILWVPSEERVNVLKLNLALDQL